VKLKADVVKQEPADTSEMFGGGQGSTPAVAPVVAMDEERLICPTLLFGVREASTM
jgi:hypothetical protein